MISYHPIKRIIDILVSVSLILLLGPLFVVVALAIKCDSRGDIFFRQQRVGKNGILFSMYKFRSMVADAPLLGPEFTSQDDVRITRVGRILRATSLDELPQLINVIKGDMSLIGPRPNTPSQQQQYTPEAWKKRHLLRPGITGLAQVSGRSDLTSEQQVAYDIQYTDCLNFMLDCRILLQTVRVAISGRGAN